MLHPRGLQKLGVAGELARG